MSLRHEALTTTIINSNLALARQGEVAFVDMMQLLVDAGGLPMEQIAEASRLDEFEFPAFGNADAPEGSSESPRPEASGPSPPGVAATAPDPLAGDWARELARMRATVWDVVCLLLKLLFFGLIQPHVLRAAPIPVF